MRRWISALLTVLMLANVAVWPTAVVAQVIEHDREAIQLDERDAPAGSVPHCKHGCVGHYGHHFQFQASPFSYQIAPAVSAAIVAAAAALPPKHIPALPFRPPLPA